MGVMVSCRSFSGSRPIVSLCLEHVAIVVFERCIVVLQFDLIVKQVLMLAVFKSD